MLNPSNMALLSLGSTGFLTGLRMHERLKCNGVSENGINFEDWHESAEAEKWKRVSCIGAGLDDGEG